MSDVVTVTDEALCALVARIPDRNPERLAEDYLPALRAALAAQPQDQRIAELEAELAELTAEHDQSEEEASTTETKLVRAEASLEGLASSYDTLKESYIGALRELDQALAREEQLREALDWFCQRVEKGEVRSTRTYQRFKELLSSTPPQALSKRDGEVLALTKAARTTVGMLEHCARIRGGHGVLGDCYEELKEAFTSTTQAAQDAEERIREDERAKCAKVADAHKRSHDALFEESRRESSWHEGASCAADDIATAIRSLSSKGEG